jgi:predicted nucleic acid-binding protein
MHYLGVAGTMVSSVLSMYEVFRGCRSIRQEQAADELFSKIPSLEVTSEIATAAARIARNNAGVLSGERSTADALIVGTVLVHGGKLVTLNTRQFSRLKVPGLELLLVDQQAADWIPA